jgi:hypothetical protein
VVEDGDVVVVEHLHDLELTVLEPLVLQHLFHGHLLRAPAAARTTAGRTSDSARVGADTAESARMARAGAAAAKGVWA